MSGRDRNWTYLSVGIMVGQLVLLTACSVHRPSPEGLLISLTPSPSVILPSATPMRLPSPVPSTPTSSPTHTPAPPTITPRPTLTAEERWAIAKEMLETNGGCELPCWWGIIPGKTDWQSVKEWFTAIGGFVFEIPSPERLFDYYIDMSFEHNHGIVESITVMSEIARGYNSQHFAQDWRRYSLDQVLTRYGLPSQVYIQFVPPLEQDAPAYYQLWLVYDHLGFYTVYTGPVAYEPPIMKACLRFKEVWSIMLYLQSPRPGEPVLESPDLHPLEEATGMDVQTFYETFRQAGTAACLESPVEVWP